jgi:ADP-heptose:LPS heptosyltransferase
VKIIIIKLGAKGDVVRTLPIAQQLKKLHQDATLTWVTKAESKELLETIPYIDRLDVIPYETNEVFDALYNFDIEEDATTCAQKINARKKFGFFKDESYVRAFNIGGEYYLNTLFDDDTKKENVKTYQEMMFETAEIPFSNEHAEIVLTLQDIQYAKEFIQSNGFEGKKIIGIHMGASPRWPSKIWHPDRVKEFVRKAHERGYAIILFGGPNESDKLSLLKKEIPSASDLIAINNPFNTDREFASLVACCNVIVCSDSFALHVALALKRPTVGLFFCTPPNEVEGYGFLRKIVSPLFEKFFPEKMDEYDESLTKSIMSDEVLHVIEECTKRN